MFQLEDGREALWQWDINTRLIVKDKTITEVHYCNKTTDCSLVTEVYEDNGIYYSDIPNILLQTDWKINVYGYDSERTKHYKCFKVNGRSKPDSYVYTETEVKSYEALEARIEALEEAEVDIDLSAYYTKEETDSLLSGYATVLDVDNVYGETNLIREELGSIESALDAIIDIQNTLLGVNAE